MALFTIIEGVFCVVRRNGVYRQCKVYRGGQDGQQLFAGAFGGFIRLASEGRTSQPDTVLIDLEYDYRKGKLGYLEYNPQVQETLSVEQPKQQQLTQWANEHR